jgi:hypothetical protein
MPPASNQFDYRLLADVVMTIEYTAMHSSDYEQRVLQALPQRVSSDRLYSLRNDWPDEWYDLMNGTERVVKLPIPRTHFAATLADLEVDQISLFALCGDGPPFELDVAGLALRQDGKEIKGGSARSAGQVVSTRNLTGANWAGVLVGRDPVGEWELTLGPSTERERLEDVMLCITYSGRHRG